MEADPAQIKVAIRADDRIGIREGGAKIEVKFDAEDGALAVFEDLYASPKNTLKPNFS